jgi:hypothetical protein
LIARRSRTEIESNVMPHLRLSSSALLAVVAFGCNAGPPPSSVTVELPETITSTDPLLIPVRAREASGAATTPKPPFDAAVTPADVASVSKAGTLSCQRTGDAKLEVTIRGVTASAAVRCRLVDRLEVPPLERLDITKGSFVLAAKAFSKDGAELSDVPITVTPSKGNRVRVNGLELTPSQVGETELSVRAGSAEKNLPIKVVRSLKPEALPMNDGKRINFSLDQGKYEIRVTLNAPKPLRVEWRGAPYCDYKGGANVTHVAGCTLQGKGGVVTDNPRYLDSGVTDVNYDGIELYEVP